MTRRLGIGLIVFGLGVATAAVLGPLWLGVIEYHVVDDVLNQVIGGDAVGLALVAPTAIAAGALVWRGHKAGPVVALAPAAYGAYTYAQLGIGGEFATLPGNSERFFPLFLGLFVLGGWILFTSLRAQQASTLEAPPQRARRVAIAVLWAIAAFLTVGLHLPGLVDVLGGPPYEVEYTQGPTVFWIVKLMDLGLVVPIAIAVAVGLQRRSPAATRAMYGVIGWGALLGSAVAGMAVVMQVNDDPAASTSNSVAFVTFALLFVGLAVWIFRPLLTSGDEPQVNGVVGRS